MYHERRNAMRGLDGYTATWGSFGFFFWLGNQPDALLSSGLVTYLGLVVCFGYGGWAEMEYLWIHKDGNGWMVRMDD